MNRERSICLVKNSLYWFRI